MKVKTSICAVAGIFLVYATTYAMPTAGLSYIPDSFSMSLSALLGYQQQTQKLIHSPSDFDDEGSSLSSYLGLKLSIYPADFFGFFGSIGTGDWRMSEINYQSFLGISYAGGVTFKIFPWKKNPFQTVLALALGGFQGSGSAQEPENWDEEESSDWAERTDIDVLEYQGSLLFSYAVERNIIPFGGVRYVAQYVRFAPHYQYNMSPMGKWGVQLGLDYFVTAYVFFSGEIQIFERTAFFMGVGLKY